MKKCKTLLTIVFLLVLVSFSSKAQEELLELLYAQEDSVRNYTIATFKSTRLVSGHSVETNAEGVLNFMIGHRFGAINTGWRDFWGLDYANVRLGLDYGITDQINIGIGRSSFQKTFDGTFKWKFLRQQTGFKNIPLTATAVGTVYLNSSEWSNPDRDNLFSSRLAYHYALLIARKFGDAVSIQLMPTVVHRNLVPTEEDNNSVVSIGAGTSIKVTNSLRFNAEYYYIPDGQISSDIGGLKVRNSLSIGIDLETGGHVFQLHLTNSRGMTEKYLVGENTGSWGKGDIHFGFNVSRVFTLKKPKEFRKKNQ
jgi:opacity protein-like surface antigen